MIDKLEMFIALAREEHFGRAATAQGVTQPTLSAAIKQLEDQLGVMLVWRGSRYQGLTPEGQRALDWARRIVGDARSLRQEMRVAREGLSGDLRLAVIPTALTVVSDRTAGYGDAHPNVRFTVQSKTSTEILSMLENLEIDAGLTYLDNEPLGRVTTVPLYAERYVLVAKSGHPLLKGPVKWADLAGVPWCAASSTNTCLRQGYRSRHRSKAHRSWCWSAMFCAPTGQRFCLCARLKFSSTGMTLARCR